MIGSSQEIFFQGTYGHASPAKEETSAYLIGSLSKQFTAAAILVLEQQGKLNTIDPISNHLDWIPKDKAQITIHQLLTHTSGLQDDYWDQHSKLSEQAYLTMMLDRPLKSTPGSTFSYANIGYHLLCKTIESITGEAYEAFLSREVWKPFGLEFTGFHSVDWEAVRVARYDDWTTEGAEAYLANPLDRPIYLQPEGSGGLLSTTEDLYKWYQVLFHSDKLLDEKSKAKLLQVDLGNYAYGWEVYQGKGGRRIVEHGGYDSWVGVVTGFYYFVEEDLVVIYLGNTHMGKWLQKEQLLSAIQSLLFGGEVQFPPSYCLMEQEFIPASVVGTYRSDGGKVQLDLGRQENQIRLRTADKQVIQQLLLPVRSEDSMYGDVQLEFILDRMNAGEINSLRDHLLYGASFNSVKQRYQQTWQRLKAGYGNFKEAKIFPSKLEVFMQPIGEGKFVYWNIKTRLSAVMNIKDGQLLINGNRAQPYVREN